FTLQLLLQLSLSIIFPSSHSSPGCKIPSPQYVQFDLHCVESKVPPPIHCAFISHDSPGLHIPSPQFGGGVGVTSPATNLQELLQLSLSIEFPSSHSSPL